MSCSNINAFISLSQPPHCVLLREGERERGEREGEKERWREDRREWNKVAEYKRKYVSGVTTEISL